MMKISFISILFAVLFCFSETSAQQETANMIPKDVLDEALDLILESEMAENGWPSDTVMEISKVNKVDIAKGKYDRFYVVDLDINVNPLEVMMTGVIIFKFNEETSSFSFETYSLAQKDFKTALRPAETV